MVFKTLYTVHIQKSPHTPNHWLSEFLNAHSSVRAQVKETKTSTQHPYVPFSHYHPGHHCFLIPQAAHGVACFYAI